MIYAIDFDGVMCENEYPRIGRAKLESIRFVKELQRRGDKWILWTCRHGERLVEATDWLAMLGLAPDAVNDNLEHTKKSFGSNPRKVYADVYVDDHNMGGLRLK